MTANFKDISVIIVSYNSEAVIASCLTSIPESIGKVFVVDNASKDKTCQEVERYPNVTLIKNDKNIGFGCANNVALEKVKTRYALLLNPDACIDENALELLQKAMNDTVAIAVPRLRKENGDEQKPYKANVFEREMNGEMDEELTGDKDVECVSGAVMLWNMPLMSKKVGFFDPDIFLFYDDDDICLRVREKGYRITVVYDAIMEHLMGKSSPQTPKIIFMKQWHMMTSRLYLEKKYQGNAQARTLAINEVIKCVGKTIGYMLAFKRMKVIKYIARAYAASFYVYQLLIFRNKA